MPDVFEKKVVPNVFENKKIISETYLGVRSRFGLSENNVRVDIFGI